MSDTNPKEGAQKILTAAEVAKEYYDRLKGSELQMLLQKIVAVELYGRYHTTFVYVTSKGPRLKENFLSAFRALYQPEYVYSIKLEAWVKADSLPGKVEATRRGVINYRRGSRARGK